MDMILDIGVRELYQLLKEIGFEKIITGNDTLGAKMKMGWGRMHVLAEQMGPGKVFVEIHRDAKIHFMFLGVDYDKRPRETCEELLERMRSKGLKGKIIGGTSWFNRRNKAIISGFKI